MSVHSSQKGSKRDWTRIKLKGVGPYKNFLDRIRRTLYYGNLPLTERLSLPVTELATELYSEVKSKHSVERLSLDEASQISRNACVSPCTLVLALIYLEQLKSSNYSYVNKVSPSDLFIVSLIVATKFLNDCGEEDDILNSEWAASVGLSLSEVNCLEREFLAAINWEVFVEQNQFWKKLRMLERDVALKEGKKRGWFSYTDLESLLDSINSLALAQAIFTVSAVCVASYTAGFLTLIGSTLLVSQLPKYPITTQQSIHDLSTPTMNTTIPLHAINTDPNVNCELTLANTVNEIIAELDWNLENEKNFTLHENYYSSFITNYIEPLTRKIQYTPLKIGTLPLDSSNFLHNCYY